MAQTITHSEFKARAQAIAQARAWRLDIQEHDGQIEAWFSDPAQNDVDTAQVYMNADEGLIGLIELEADTLDAARPAADGA